MKKLNMAILTVLLVFQTILSPLGMFGVSFASAEDSSNSQSIGKLELAFEKLVYNDKTITDQESANEIKPKADEKVKIYYTFKKPDDVEMNEGDTFKFNLPEQLLLYDAKALSGDIKVGDKTYFSYETNVETKEVTITATQQIPQGIAGGINFSAVFGNFKTQNLEGQELIIQIPNKDAIVLTFDFAPKVEGQNISKEGKPGVDAAGNKIIDWEVWFNLSGKELGDVTFEDIIGVGHKYVQDTLKVSTAQVEATLEGVGLAEGAQEVPVTPNDLTATENSLAFKVTPGKDAVKVTYRTIIDREPSEEVEAFSNAVKVTGENLPDIVWEVAKIVEVTYGKPLTKKKVSGDKYRADWLIQFNRVGKNLPPNTTLTDTVTNHIFDQDSLEVIKYDLVKGEWAETGTLLEQGEDKDYIVTFNEVNNEFTITLLKGGIYAVDVKYSTLTDKEFVYEAGAVNNTLETSLQKTETEKYHISTEFDYPAGVGYKDLTNIDYAKRELEWTVKFDTEGRTVNDFTISDEFTEGLTLIPYEGNKYFDVKQGPENTQITFTNVETGKGFDVKLKDGESFKGVFIFTYKTKYDVLAKLDKNFEGYKNKAKFSWKGENEKVENVPKSATFKPLESHNNNAEKFGSYNYKERKFNWTAHINQDRVTLSKGTTVVDTLGTGHKLVTGSVKIYDATVNRDGSLTKGAETTDFTVTEVDDTFVATLNVDSKTKPYIIEYQSEDEDGIVGQTDKTGDYENSLVVTAPDGTTLLGKAEKTVTVDRPNELIQKLAKTNPDDSTVKWTVDINASGSKLKQVTLKDVLSSNDPVKQTLIKDSFKIQEIVFTENGISYGATKALTEATDWVASSTINEANFVIQFNDLLQGTEAKGFRVTYDSYYDGPDKGSFGNSATIQTESTTAGASTSSGVKEEESQYVYNDSSAYADFKRVKLNLTKLGINQDLKEQQGESYEGNPLAGVTFTLYNKSKTYQIATAKTNKNGLVTFLDVGYGAYKLVETHSLEGFDGNEDEYDVVISKTGVKIDNKLFEHPAEATEVSASVENNEYVNSVELTKTGVDKTKVTQVEFNLYKNGELVKETKKAVFKDGVRELIQDKFKEEGIIFKPDAEGKFNVSYLGAGTYSFKEIKTAPGYEVNTTPLTFTISGTAIEQQNLTFANTPLKVTVTNVEEGTTTKIQGSKFAIYEVDSCVGLDSPFTPGSLKLVTKYTDDTDIPLTTESKGQIEVDFSKLAEGNYVIVQDQVNKYYKNKENVVATCVVNDGKTPPPENPTFPNERVTDNILPLTLEKVDAADKNLAVKEAVIKLTGIQTGKTYFGKTGTDGKISEWYAGSYPTNPSTATAVNPVPDQYAVSESIYAAGYTKLAQNGNDGFISELVFDYNNTGKYEEIKVTNTKILRDIVITNTCGKEVTTYKLVNTKDSKTITADVLGKELSEYTITAEKSNGTVVDGASIAADGTITMPAGADIVKITGVHLEKGTYKIEQLTSSSGCKLVDEDETKSVDGKPSDTLTFNETDPPITVTVTNKDKDSTDVIEGSTFKLYKKGSVLSCPEADETTGKVDLEGYNLVENYLNGDSIPLKTDGKGQFKVDFSQLEPGTYIIVQDQVNTYYVNKENVPVKIDGSNCIEIESNVDKNPSDPTFENERTPVSETNVTLKKTDANETSRFLAGAVIKLTGTQFTNKKTYYGKTDANGSITKWYESQQAAEQSGEAGTEGYVTKLQPNNYEVTEVVYPEGYKNLAGTTELDYKNDTTSAHIAITNEKIINSIEITNSCAKEETLYQLVQVNTDGTTKKVWSTDLSNKPIGETKTVDDESKAGVFAIPAGTDTKGLLANLHLPVGNYKVVQLTTTADCLPKDSPIFEVPENSTEPIEVDETDTPIYAVTLTFNNCDGLIANGEYTLTGTSGDANGKTYTVTVVNEVVTVKDTAGNKIPAGKYSVTGDNIKSDVTIEVTATGENKFPIATEDCYEPTIEFKKCDQPATTLAGTYDVYKKDGTDSYRILTVDVQGKGTLNNVLPVGDYIIKVGDATYDLNVKKDTTTVTIQTTENCHKAVVTFKTCNVIGTDMSYALYEKGTDETYTKVSDSTYTGTTVTLTELKPNGEYILIPTIANGNPTAPFTKEFVVGKDAANKTVMVEVQTSENCEKLVITFNSCDSLLANKEHGYTVNKIEGENRTEITVEATTDANGQVTITGLLPGTYEIVKDGKKETVVVEQGKPSEVAVQTSTDCYKAEIEFKKCEGPLTGEVNYKVVKDGDITFTPVEITNLTDGKVTLENLAPGTYTIKDATGEMVQTFEVTEGQMGTTLVTIQTTENCTPTCEKEVTVEVTPDTTIEVNGKTYTDEDGDGQVVVPMTDLPEGETTPVTQDGKEIGTITTDNCEGTFTPTQPTPEPPTCEKEVTVEVTLGTTIEVNGKTYTDEDGDGKVNVPMTDLPESGTTPVTQDGKEIGTITTENCEGTFTPTQPTPEPPAPPAPSCEQSQVTLTAYANETVFISKDGGAAVTVSVGSNGTLTIPYSEGNIVVSDVSGNKIGSVTLVDCAGTFEFVNACTAATLTVTELAGKTVTAEHASGTVSVTFDANGKVQLPFTDGLVTLKDGDKTIGSVTLTNCEGTFKLEVEKEACTYPESVTVPTEHAGETATVTNGTAKKDVVVPDTGIINIPFTEGTTTVTIDGVVVATVDPECKVVVETEDVPVDPVKPEGETPEPVVPVDPPVEPTPEPTPVPTPTPTPIPPVLPPTDPKPTPEPTPEPEPGPEPDPEQPVDPKPDEEKPEPVEPVDPKPEQPETPGTNEPKPEPEKPVTPTPNPERPSPTPKPEQPAPTPGNTGGNTGSTTPGTNTGTNTTPPANSVKLPPKVENIVNKWDNAVSNYPQAKVPQSAMQDLLTLAQEYENMTESERRAVEKEVNMKKVYDILIAEGLLTNADRPSFLPQTDGDFPVAWTYVGLMMVLVSAFFLARRRKA